MPRTVAPALLPHILPVVTTAPPHFTKCLQYQTDTVYIDYHYYGNPPYAWFTERLFTRPALWTDTDKYHITVGLKSDGTTGRRDRRRDTCRSIRHGPLSRSCRRATDTRGDTGPWRCSSDGTDDETRLIVRRYVVRHHVFNVKLRFIHH